MSLFLPGCSAVKVLTVAGKGAKATGTAAKAGTAAKVAGKGATVVAATHADDLFRIGRLADDADAVIMVGSELPKATKGVKALELEHLDHFLTGFDVTNFVLENWEDEYELGEDGPAGMGEAFSKFPSTKAISPAMPTDERYWVQWLSRPEGDRLGVFDPKDMKVAILKPQRK